MGRRDRSAAFLIAAAVWVGLFALGSVPRWAACLTAALGLAAAMPYLTSRRSTIFRDRGAARQVPPLLLLAGMAAAFTAVQLLPLPASLVAWLAPARHALAMDNAAALGTPIPRLLPLSYDPPATLVELAKLAGYLGFALACTRLAASARGRAWLAGTCAAAGAALALTALGHHALGLDALFGLYHPREIRPVYLAPLLNPNHLAGFLALSAPLALALAVAATGGRRLLWVGAATACAATNLLLASRAGALALAAGLALAVGLLVAQRRRRRELRLPWSVRIPAGVVAACALVLLASFTAGDIRDELAATSLHELHDPGAKAGIWRASMSLVDENAWTGVGRGAFEPAFTRFHHGGVKTYSHVENEYLQAAVDWGLPAAAALLLALVWLLRAALRRWHAGPIEAGALAAVAAIGLHNGADFNLQLPGVALAAIATLAVLLPGRAHTLPASRRRKHLAARVAAVAAGAVVIGLAASPLGREARVEGNILAGLLEDAAAPASGRAHGHAAGHAADPAADLATAHAADLAIQRGHRAIARHPADYLLVGLTAQAYFRKRDLRAVRVVNRALALNPEHPGLHALAARMLLAAGHRDQALLEYHLALRHTLTPGELLVDLLRWFPDPEEAARGIPAQPDRVAIMANRLVTLGRADVALTYGRRAYEQHPHDFQAQRTLAALALDQGALDLAIDAGWPAYQHSRHAAEALVLGRALRAAGRLDEARTVIEDTIARRNHDHLHQLVRLHAALALVHEDREDHRAARASLRTALGLAEERIDRHTRAGLHRSLARVEDRLGNPLQAAAERKRADALAAP